MNVILNDVYLFFNGTVARVVEVNHNRKSIYNPGSVKLRCIRRVVGTQRPYTYQRWCYPESLSKAKRIPRQTAESVFFTA